MAGRSPRSAARSSTPPEREVVFVVDECLGGNLVKAALEAEGATVKLVKEEFGEGAQDVSWLPEVGARGWVVLTKDKRIRRRPAERDAYVAAGVRGFFLAAKNLNGPEMAELLASEMPRMLRLIGTYEAPFIAIVRRSGVVMYQGEDCPPVRRRARRGAGR